MPFGLFRYHKETRLKRMGVLELCWEAKEERRWLSVSSWTW